MQPSGSNDLMDLDPVLETGCQDLNDAVLLCYADKKDWRACKKELQAFKVCMDLYQRKQAILIDEMDRNKTKT